MDLMFKPQDTKALSPPYPLLLHRQSNNMPVRPPRKRKHRFDSGSSVRLLRFPPMMQTKWLKLVVVHPKYGPGLDWSVAWTPMCRPLQVVPNRRARSMAQLASLYASKSSSL